MVVGLKLKNEKVVDGESGVIAIGVQVNEVSERRESMEGVLCVLVLL